MTQCISFKPQINKDSKILILGSMPGIKSLEMQQYYAHPQNRFWKLMAIICNIPNLYNFDYKDKIDTLLQNKFALWDVVKYCERTGSLDSNIKNEVPNEIPELLNRYSNIKKICFNGNKSYSAFKKYYPHILNNYECIKLPSSSPANAKYKLKDLYNEWYKSFNS